MILPRGLAVAAISLVFSVPTLAEDLKLFEQLKAPSPSSRSAAPAVVPNTYIVELKTEENGLTRRSDGSHAEFHRLSKKADLAYDTREVYSDSAIFVGLSLTLSSDADVQALKDLDNVVAVWPVFEIKRPLAVMPAGISKMSRRAVYPGTNITQPHIVGDIDVNSPHAMAKVDELHAKGIKGKGIKIGIIDSGVDYRHPSLGGGFGPGYKISFGYDFVEKDADPLVTCVDGGHGTHVAGIIGMQDQPGTGFGLIGVAPEADIGMYRVFSCTGSASSDIIISALLQSAADQVDIVSMSLGLLAGDEQSDPFAQITSNLVAQGIAVVAAAGNDGASGAYSASAPGLGKDVFSVGSTDNTKFPVTYQLKDNNGRSLRYSAVLPLDAPSAGLTVQVLNYGGASAALQGCTTTYYRDAAANLTAQGLSPANYILFVKNGGCSSLSKGQAAAQYGYKYFASYITPDLSLGLHAYADVSPGVISIAPIVLNEQDSTTALSSYAKKPGQYKVFFSATDYAAKSPPTLTPGLMSNYSTIGPTYQLNLKPQLSAPGGLILATWPLDFFGGYAVISGTSMATPFMSGCFALLKSQKPTLSVHELYALLSNSAGAQLPWLYDPSILSSAAHQGAGSVNVANAIAWESLVTPPQLNLGYTTAPVTANVTITNRSTRSKTYTFEHKPAGGMQYAETATWQYGMQYPWYANVTFGATSVKLEAGQSTVLTITASPPTNVPAKPYLYPFYTGFVVVKNNFETYTVPYAGTTVPL